MAKNRISTQKLIDWITPQLTTGVRGYPGRLPDVPNRAFGLTMQTGAGLVHEEKFDVIAFQIVSRGGENNLNDAEEIATEIDNVLIHCADNFAIGVPGDDVWCNYMGRLGGNPAQVPYADSEARYMFTCTYFAQVST